MTTKAHSKFIFACLSLGLAFVVCPAQADSLSDLKGALARLHGQTPIKTKVDVNYVNRMGEGKKLENVSAQFSLTLEGGARGLQFSYGKDLMAKLDEEEHAKEKNSKSKSPTFTAFNDVKASSLRTLLSPNSALLHRLEKATLKSEKVEALNGKNVRVLSFETPIESIDAEERDRIKKFESNFKIWIAEDGTPLLYRSSHYFKVSLLMMMSMELQTQDDYQYVVVGDRLVIQKAENKTNNINMVMNQKSTVIKTLTVL